MESLKSFWRRVVWAVLVLYFLSVFAFALQPVLHLPIPRLLGPMSTLLVWAFALGHALWSWGGRRALLFFGTAFAIGLVLEAVGVATGLVYGGYHYSSRLGPKLFEVPLLIPLSWAMVVYLAHAVAQRLTGDGDRSPTVGRAVFFCVIGAVVTTAWDVVADPQMARTGLWVWDTPGEFFGVPVHNFAGWWVTSFLVLAVFRVLTRRCPPEPWGDSSPVFAGLPIAAYGGLTVSFFLSYALQGDGALAVVTLFTMGTITLAAVARG